MPNRPAATVAVAITLAGLLFGCTHPAPPPAPASSDPPRAVERLWRVQAGLIGEVAVAGGTAVSYVRDGDRLAVVAWDLESGRELWRDRAAPGSEEPGAGLAVAALEVGSEGFVAYLAPGRSIWQRVRVAEARTGEVVALDTMIVSAGAQPRSCGTGTFCVVAVTGPEAAPRPLRVDVRTRRVVDDRTAGPPDEARFLDSGVFATDARPPDGVERLGLWEDGKVVWERPYAEVFGPGSSSDTGWAWAEDAADGLLVGTGGRYQGHWEELAATGEASTSLTGLSTVAVRRVDGATVWRLEHVMACTFVGLGQRVEPDRVTLCRINAGTWSWQEVGDEVRTGASGFDVDLLGVELRTGRILWEVPIGGGGYDDDTPKFVATAFATLVRTADRTIRVDHRTGAVEELGAGSRLACHAVRPALVLEVDGEAGEHDAGEDVRPCDETGATASSWSAEAAESAGVAAGDGRWLLGTPDGLVAVRVSGR